MRLNPPLTVLSLIALTFVVLGLSRQVTDCAYQPDGGRRWNAVAEWFTDPGDPLADPGCDVWHGIEPRKRVGTIQLQWTTSMGAPVVGRISPDGSGFVAILSPVVEEADGLLIGDVFASLDQYRGHAVVFEIEPADPGAYERAYRELAPVRDFQDDTSGWFEDPDPLLRQLLELDHSLTRPIICRRKAEVVPWLGTVVAFGSEAPRAYPHLVTNLECLDVAYAGMVARERRAIVSLKQATGSADEIRAEEQRDHPECRKDSLRCYGPIL